MKKNHYWKSFGFAAGIAASLIALHSCGKPESSDFDFEDVSGVKGSPYPNFRGGEVQGEKNFATLINNYAQGRSKITPWAGYFWPYKENGIAAGKYGSGASPAGKYDAARGGQTNSQSWEVKFHGAGVKGVQGWWGHCNGWCVAAALYAEPKEPSIVNGITFDIGDIKGLITEAGMHASADFFGNRVDWGSDYNTPKADDTVPAQFFLVLTNHMGKLQHSVLIDRFTGNEVWNQPVAGYRFEYPTPADYLGADPAAPGVYRINLTSTMWWMRDDVLPGIQTPEFDFPAGDTDTVQQRTFKMELWLDGPVQFDGSGKITSSGNVIVTRQGDYFVGGVWKMGGFYNDAWPDYMWVPYSIVPPTDPDDDNVNPQIDVRWLENHVLVPGGKDDPSARPRPIEPAPRPSASPEPSSSPTSRPEPEPTATSTGNPEPRPTFTFPWPFPTSTSAPTSGPTSEPRPEPVPFPTSEPRPNPNP